MSTCTYFTSIAVKTAGDNFNYLFRKFTQDSTLDHCISVQKDSTLEPIAKIWSWHNVMNKLSPYR